MTAVGTRIRILAGAHLAQAGVLLAQPPNLMRGIAGHGRVPPSWVGRLLGLRLLAQGAAEIMHPDRGLLRVGVAVDLTHAATMLAAGRIWPRYRRAALISAGCAAASAGLGASIAEVGE
jgi:hypothetical protein